MRRIKPLSKSWCDYVEGLPFYRRVFGGDHLGHTFRGAAYDRAFEFAVTDDFAYGRDRGSSRWSFRAMGAVRISPRYVN